MAEELKFAGISKKETVPGAGLKKCTDKHKWGENILSTYMQCIQSNNKKRKISIKNGLATARHFIKQYMLMVNNHTKMWSTLLVIKGMEIKTTKSLHCPAVKMPTIKKSDQTGKDK